MPVIIITIIIIMIIITIIIMIIINAAMPAVIMFSTVIYGSFVLCLDFSLLQERKV